MIRQIAFEGINQVNVRRAPAPPAPEPGQVLLAPAYVGICGTDLHVLHGRYASVQLPLIIGHEMAGVVEHVGPCVTDLFAGDNVVLNPVVPCGTCPACARHRPNICSGMQVIGFRRPGAAQTRMVVPRTQLHTVPPGLPLHRAVLAEPLSVAMHAVGRAEDISDVLVIGGGTIGLCVLLALKVQGAGRITVVEPVAAKRALALCLGAAEALAPSELPGTARYTACLDIVASAETLAIAQARCLPGGTVVVVGTAMGPATLDTPRAQRFEISLRGSSIFLADDMERALQALDARQSEAGLLISSIENLDDAASAYAKAAEPDAVKMVIQLN